MKTHALIFTILFFLGIGCQRYPANVEKALVYSGENRAELEKVLTHYAQTPADSLKYRAALFLIEHMPGHYCFFSEELEKYWNKLETIPHIARHVKKMLQTIPYRYPEQRNKMTIQEDIKCIQADYLISRIDKAFSQWAENPWLQDLDYETFQHHLLPYRIANEPLDYWRDSNAIFQQQIQACIKWNDDGQCNLSELAQHFSAFSNHLPQYIIDPKYKDFQYECTTNSMIELFAMYTIGIPAAIDFTPGYANHNNRHYWMIPLDPQIKKYTCTQLQQYIPGKIYRKTYAHQPIPQSQKGEYIPPFFRNPFQKDVTHLYVPTSEVHLKSEIKSDNQYAYLCVFNDLQWRPIAWSKLHRGKANFKQMNKKVVYLPVCYSKEEELFPIASPFILHENGKIESLKIIPDSLQTMVIKRKYSQLGRSDNWTNKVIGGRFEASHQLSFNEVITLATITQQPDHQYNSFSVDTLQPYRFWRFVFPPTGCTLAEIQFIDAQGNQLSGKLIGKDTLKGKSFFDKDPLTQKNDWQWIGMDFGKPVKVSQICYLPQNDANGIFPGDLYELFYYQLPEGWISAGSQTATTDSLCFEQVPAGTLYWLRNYINGQEERIFTWENGQVHFW